MIFQEWHPHAYSSSILFKRIYSSHSSNDTFNRFLKNSELKNNCRDPWVEFINGQKSDWLTGLVVKVKPLQREHSQIDLLDETLCQVTFQVTFFF
jgi:hypothetical protein